jgi:hypothetical protein
MHWKLPVTDYPVFPTWSISAATAHRTIRIVAQFFRVNMTLDNGIFFNASVRREGSTRLGEDNRYGIFPAAGLGVDVLRYTDLGPVSALKVRLGYGITGSLPNESGLAQDVYLYSFQGGGNVQKIPGCQYRILNGNRRRRLTLVSTLA